MLSIVISLPTHAHKPGDPMKHIVNKLVKVSDTDDTYLIPSKKITKVMLPWVIGFQEAKSYLRSSGRPMKLATMLTGY